MNFQMEDKDLQVVADKVHAMILSRKTTDQYYKTSEERALKFAEHYASKQLPRCLETALKGVVKDNKKEFIKEAANVFVNSLDKDVLKGMLSKAMESMLWDRVTIED